MLAWLTPDTPGGNSVRRVLHIPDELLVSVNGALEQLTDAENWEAFGTMTPEEAAAAADDMVQAYYLSGTESEAVQPYGILSPALMTDDSADMDFVALANAITGGFWLGSAPVDGMHIAWEIAASDGDELTVTMMGRSRTNNGVVYVYLDGDQVAGPWDMYSAAGAPNVIWSSSGIAIVGSGKHRLELRVDGKHASSTGYNITPHQVYWKAVTP